MTEKETAKNWQKYMKKNGSQNIVHQAVKDNDPWNKLNEYFEHVTNCLSLLPGQSFQATA